MSYDDYFEPADPWGDAKGGGTLFEGVMLVKRGEKADYIRFPGKREPHWVPHSQTLLGTTVKAEGDVGNLEVTRWLAERWSEEGFDPDEEDPPEQGVAIPNCVCLRDPPKSKAILVRIRDEATMINRRMTELRPGESPGEVWIPRSQILSSSQVKEDGDVGTLVVTEWMAEQKGLSGDLVEGARPGAAGTPKKKPRRRTAADDLGKVIPPSESDDPDDGGSGGKLPL